MYSLNAPVPGAISALAWDLRSALTGFERIRDELTLVVKRMEGRSAGEFAAEERAIRQAIAGTAPMEAAVVGVDVFEEPPAGPAPVVYLEVESPGLIELHTQLVEHYGALGPVEGADYTPHITLARGTDDPSIIEMVREVAEPQHTWTIDRLVFWDARRGVPAGEVSLPT